jgi:class 3 adenylate cyclase/tetratricopeptide (TPR) repeat protein
VLCAQCGAESPDGFRFCGACGAPLTVAVPARESRKTVTVLFCDVAGSTALGERLDPESLRRVMRRYFTEIQGIVERHGGTVEKFIGDAAMAVFGLPRVHEDDALRAVRAASEIRERLPAVAAEVGVTLTFRTGVNTGPVVVGTGTALVVGDAVNVAARLEQAAPLGEILIGADTWRLVRDAVEVEAVEPLSLKGKTLPVAAYRLRSVDPQAPAYARHLDAPLVGRERELGLLRHAFDRAVGERGCHLFTLLGPAGIGKSRLAAAWLESIPGEATVVRGRCLHYGEGITFWPLVEILVQLGDPAAETLEHVTSGGAASAQELFLDVRRLLERTAAERPLVVVLDDLQWAQPTLLDLLDHVADLSRSAPILLLCLARPDLLDERPTWAGGKLNATTVLLEPLGPGECEQLLEHLGETLDPTVAARIVAASEGNPLFLEEMLAYVREGGDAGVPPTIQALLAARLEQLRDDVRAIVDRGAVEGKVFHRGAVLELAPDALRRDIDAHLVALVRKELIRPDVATLPGEDAYRFRNLLVRDAAYDALPKETRAELHEAFAGWIERVAAELVELDEIAGWHLEQSVRYRGELGLEPHPQAAARASRHLADAGRRAAARADLPAADSLLTRAHELARPGDPDRARIALALAEALVHLGHADRVPALVEEALAEPSTRTHARLARLAYLLETQPGAYTPEAEATLPEVIEELQRAGDERGLAKAQLAQFQVHWLGSRAKPAAEAALAAAAHADRAGDRGLLGQAVGWLSGSFIFGPEDPAAVRSALGRIEAWDAGPFAETGAAFLRAHLARAAGRLDEAREHIRTADDGLRELGFEVLRASIGQFTARVEMDAGDVPEAVRQLRESCERSEAVGDRGYLSTTRAYLAAALAEAGDPEEAERVAQVAMEESAPEDVINFVVANGALALALADRGRLEEAEARARGALEYALRTDFSAERADALVVLARVLAERGRAPEAIEAMEQAIGLYEHRGERLAIDRARRLAAGMATAPSSRATRSAE